MIWKRNPPLQRKTTVHPQQHKQADIIGATKLKPKNYIDKHG
jgi:hypothetical protein